ncbi:unnamed protein product [Choristocarpus tenellus]
MKGNKGFSKFSASQDGDMDAMENGSATSRARLTKGDRSDKYAPLGGGYEGSETSEISAGPEKWRRVRRGAHVSYQPFDVEDYQDAQEEESQGPKQFPPPSETNDDSKNWPKSCPFLHLKFDEFSIQEKCSFIAFSYYYWYFLTFVLLFSLMSAIVTSLISPSPKEETVYLAFVLAFIGFWWFFFGHFRLLYSAMRYRKSVLYTLYQLETIVIFFLACYQIFSLMGSMTLLLAPLAPGSPVPVRQNPGLAVVTLGVGAGLWFIVLLCGFYQIRKAHYFKSLPLSIERSIYLKEIAPGGVEIQQARFSSWLLDKFREKPDSPSQPTKCGMLQGKDLWLQGMLTLETVYLEFKADVHIFDHFVHERYHYQDVLAVRRQGTSCMVFKIVHPTKRQLDDLEIVFDFQDPKICASMYKRGRNLWRRVGRNMDLLLKERTRKLKKLRRAGRGVELDMEEPDLVEAFNKARRMETRERLDDHMVTYKEWQKVLEGVKIHVLTEGQTLLSTGEEFTSVYHVAQGSIDVNEQVDIGSTLGDSVSDLLATPKRNGHAAYESDLHGDGREQQSYAKVSCAKLFHVLYFFKQEGGEGEVEDSQIEYEDPEDVHNNILQDDSGSSEESSEEEMDDDVSDRDDESDFSSDLYTNPGPEMVLLGTLRKDDIFGVVPFLLSKENQVPTSGLNFTANDDNTVVFSVDTAFLKGELLKPKKDITSAFYKYLAVILGERTEAAEDAMFNRKVREKRLEVARLEEEMLAAQWQAEEEQGIGADPEKAGEAALVQGTMTRDQDIRQLFNFTATEHVAREFKGRYVYFDQAEKKEVKITGTFYITTHYFAFAGKKIVDVSHLEINRQFKDVMRHDEVITIRYAGSKGVLFTNLRQQRKLFEVKSANSREVFFRDCMSKWKREDEVTSKEMRKTLRRKMTRLSLGYLNQARTGEEYAIFLLSRIFLTEQLTQKSIGVLMSDMSEKEKKQLFAGSVPIGLNRNQVVIGEHNFNDNLYLLCTGIVRVQRVQEHVSNVMDSGKALDRVVFQEIHSGEIFGFDSFLTGSPAYSSIVVDSEKAVVRSCTKEQIMARLREDRRLASKFYRIAAVSIASRLAEISPLDIYL